MMFFTTVTDVSQLIELEKSKDSRQKFDAIVNEPIELSKVLRNSNDLIELIKAFEWDKHTDQILTTVTNDKALFCKLFPNQETLILFKKDTYEGFHGKLDSASQNFHQAPTNT